MTALPKPAISLLIDALDGDTPLDARFYLFDLLREVDQHKHDELHTLATSLAKGVPAAALALALVYDQLSFVRREDGNAEQQADFDRRVSGLRAEVGGWAAILKARTYHARLADWKASQPRAPKLGKASPRQRRTRGESA